MAAAEITHKQAKRLLNPASGFLQGYDYSLNPYVGCAFSCSYCYVRQMPVALFRGKEWGTWVDVKTGASEQLRKELQRAKKKGGTTIFMSSSTDPYQPQEVKEQVTRGMLEVMAEERPDFLFVQTRSPLVTRDIDLLLRLGERTRVSMTIETDLEPVRRRLTPAAPPIAARMLAVKKLAEAGIPVQATVAPLLPCSDEFPRKLAEIVDRVCVDDFFMGDGSHGKRSERNGISGIFQEEGWEQWYDRSAYLTFKERLLRYFPTDRVGISQEGFMP